jgi:hypothetical protein
MLTGVKPAPPRVRRSGRRVDWPVSVDHTWEMDGPLSRVGAPRVEALPPLPGTPGGEFYAWLTEHADRVQVRLDDISRRWKSLGSFIEVNYPHPELGMSGAVIMTSRVEDFDRYRHRITRITVIPHDDVAPYLPRWRRGEAVLVSVDDMPEPLALRYANTRVKWSLNVPIMVSGQWVGLVGAVSAVPVPESMLDAYRALGVLIEREFSASRAWDLFRATLAGDRSSDDKRFPQTVHEERRDG